MKKQKNLVFSVIAVIATFTILCAVVAVTQAATTIGTNISTTGNLTATGNTSLGDAATDTLTIQGATTLTTAATGLFNVLTGNLKVGDATPSIPQGGEDAYVEGTLEVDGISQFENAIIINPSTTGIIIDYSIEIDWTTGTLIYADFSGATTQTGDITGIDLNFNNNFSTIADADVTGYRVTTPAFTQSTAATTNYTGFRLPTAGALIQNTAAGAIHWAGAVIQMPAITETTGEVTAYGVDIYGGTVTSGEAVGVRITMNAAANDAINIGTGRFYSTGELTLEHSGATASDVIDIDYVNTAYTNGRGLVDIARTGAFTGTNNEKAIDLKLTPNFTLTEPVSGSFAYNGLEIDMRNVAVTAGVGTADIIGLRVRSASDSDSMNFAIQATGISQFDFGGITSNAGAVTIIRSENITGQDTKIANDLYIAPSFTLTDPASGTMAYYGAQINMNGLNLTGAGGNTNVAALYLKAATDADIANSYSLLADGNAQFNNGAGFGDANITNVGDIDVDSISADATSVDYNDVNILELTQEDVGATCTLGQIRYDTGGAADELCYCQATNTWMCATVSAGPVD